MTKPSRAPARAALLTFTVLAGNAAAVPAQTCPAVAVSCLQPAPLADAGGARFAWGAAAGKSSQDAWVARFERGAKTPSWKTPIAGPGDDAVATVTLTPGGELLVAGSTTSPTLDGLAGRSSGGRDGFVVRLDARSGRLLSGTFVGGPGNEELSGVTADKAGNIFVSGTGKPPALGPAPATLVVVEPNSAAGPGTDAFLATLDSGLVRLQSQSLLGPVRVKHPRVWLDCAGNVVVGVAALGGGNDCAGSWPDLVYEQDQITQNYEIDHDWGDTSGNLGTPPGGWGYHAMRWKDYHANANLADGESPYILDWALRPVSPEIPKDWNPTCNDAGTLNALETYLFLQDGTPHDPPGWWMCGNHTDTAQLALFAAHFFHRWGTPVYTHLGYWDNLYTKDGNWGWFTGPVALEHVKFRPFCPFDPNGYNGETLDDLCDLDVNNVDSLTCTSSDGIPGVDGGDFFLRFESFKGSTWGLMLTWWSPLAYWPRDMDWWWQEWYEPGEYLMDPPPGSAPEVAILQEAARQSSGRIVRSGTVQVTRWNGGVPACKQTVKADIPASE